MIKVQRGVAVINWQAWTHTKKGEEMLLMNKNFGKEFRDVMPYNPKVDNFYYFSALLTQSPEFIFPFLVIKLKVATVS